MQMWSGRPAGAADATQPLTALHRVTVFDCDVGQVEHHRHQPITVIDDDGVAGVELLFGKRDRAIGGGNDWRAFGDGIVQSGVAALFLAAVVDA